MDLVERYLEERKLEKQGLQPVEPGDYVDLFIFHQSSFRLLIVKGERNPVFGRKSGMWGIISETIEPTDGILLAACNRAIQEEVARDKSLFRINFNCWNPYLLSNGEIVHRVAVSFLGEPERDDFAPQSHTEITDYQWVDLRTLANMTTSGMVEPYVLPVACWYKFYEVR